MEQLGKKVIKHLVYLFVGCCIISFLYCIITGTFNGDFLGVEVTLSLPLLLMNLLFSILPFFLVWKIYCSYKKKVITKQVTIPLDFFFFFLIFVMFWNAIVTIIYGVGIMGAPAYSAPAVIKPIIQVMNRFNYMYGVFIYILASTKNDKKQFILVALLLILAYLRAGLGVFMYLGMLYYLKYFLEISTFIKRKFIFIVPILVLFPLIVTFLYQVRSELRNQSDKETSQNPISGVLIGRLSSFSDSGFILQEAPYFFLNASQLDNFYFQKQALTVFSLEFLPVNRPEIMLFKFFYEDSEDNVAYMAGTQGNLYISLMKSIQTLVLNFVTIFIYIYLTFMVFRLIRLKYNNELAMILLLYVVMSGVSNEYAFIVFSASVFVILFLFINYLKELK